MNKRLLFLFDLLLLFIITIPTFISLLNNQYFSMHDDQHVARLFLLDQGMRQGNFYPRFVGGLGFGYGYPLFNFYPPLVYYLGEFFHLIGFSYFWSIKLVFILGFVVAAFGIYLLVRKKIGRFPALLSVVLYNYFFYHAVNAYVRGALAEFFSMGIIPFVFLALDNLAEKRSLRNSFWFGVSIALLIICHPLIAFPSIFYIGLFFIYYFFSLQYDRIIFFKQFIVAWFIGLSLSAFFWLPSMVERQNTLVDSILTKELASYKIHYVNFSQFLYSLWGYGGSIAGPTDGLTFQLGKIHIVLALSAFFLSILIFLRNKNKDYLKYFYFVFFLLIFSLWMSTQLSSFIWDNVKYLWYLQFPWRFLTFAGLFISIAGGYFAFFLLDFFSKSRLTKLLNKALIIFLLFMTVIVYQKYFRPQKLLTVTDKKLTSFQEISWRVSRTSFEFVPKGVQTKKSELGTTVLDIDNKNLPKQIYQLNKDEVKIEILENKFVKKTFKVNVESPAEFQLNTFHFLGWTAYLDNQKIKISSNNKLKLITVQLPKGEHTLSFIFEDTLVRKIANGVSLLATIFLAVMIKLTK